MAVDLCMRMLSPDSVGFCGRRNQDIQANDMPDTDALWPWRIPSYLDTAK
jgi:hypothetical protein